MSVEVSTELQGTLVALLVGAGDPVRAGGVVALVESMKMHHEVLAPVDGVVDAVVAVEGSMLSPGDVVVTLGPPIAAAAGDALPPVDVSSASSLPKGLDRPDLAEVIDRHESGLDAARPDAVEKRRRRNRRTARENVADLVDEGSFIEYGPLVIAAQRRRRDVADLIAKTPADGLVGGIGDINGHLFADARTRKAIAVSYDYTVLAGTQGTQNHRKKDRLFELAEVAAVGRATPMGSE
jgi:pyruvate/2-oxoglutarate dehydrogenase complex dihydrolipoamide acyltransferase (E2) component